MLNIVIPMAGRGVRFMEAGYCIPKPLIPVHTIPMIQLVINNIKPRGEHRFIFICIKEHIVSYKIDQLLKGWAPVCEIVEIDAATEGAACTVLLAKELINNEHPLMIANCDQWVDVDINDYIAFMYKNKSDGLIMTMRSDHPKWSYVRLDEDGLVCEVVEKKVVSNEATVGIYNYRKGSDFVSAAEKMISKNIRVNNEFYVAPVYNEFILTGAKIGYYNIGKDGQGMYGLGLPEDLEKFSRLAISHRAVSIS